MKEYDISSIEAIIKYSFKNKQLLLEAFTHASYTNENQNQPSYERLEFLGDATLEFIVSSELHKRYSHMNEGQLSKARSRIVSNNSLSKEIDNLNIIKYLRVGKGEIQHNITSSSHAKCDLFESILGAILIDNDYDVSACKNFVLSFLLKRIESVGKVRELDDHKSIIFEKLTRNKDTIEFVFEDNNMGEDFKVNLFVNGEYACSGEGRTKKRAEQMACKAYLELDS